MLNLLLWILLVAIDMPPELASRWAARIIGAPELQGELIATCRRESHCLPVSIHDGDRKFAQKMYRKAVRVGWLSPEVCIWHRQPAEEFGTRGAYGTSAAYTLHHLGPCVPPQALDVPLLGAIAAGKRMLYQCRVHRACSSRARHQMWAGRHKKI